jgi:aspartate racemase
VLYSVDFAGIAAMQRAGSWDAAAAELAEAARGLESAGADMVLLCTNTMHKVADQVQASLTVPLLHIADTTAAAVATAGLRRVGLLGTAFTMEQSFYRDRLATRGLEVVVPGPEDRALVHRVIYDELCLGTVSDESRAEYQAVIGRLVDDGAEGVLLACTEIELLITADDSPVPVFPTTQLHVVAAVDLALADGG